MMTATSNDTGAGLAGWRGYDRRQQADVLGRARRHSRLVRRLRRILPVLAGALVVAMLLANGRWILAYGPVSVGRISVENGVLVMENPRLNGYSRDNRSYEVSAVSAAQDMSTPEIVRLDQVVARITEEGGQWTSVNARSGLFHSGNETLRLEDNIVVRTDQGYEMRLEVADIAMKTGNVVSDRPVQIDVLSGVLRAGRMEIENKGERMVFSGNVTLRFRPKAGGNSNEPR